MIRFILLLSVLLAISCGTETSGKNDPNPKKRVRVARAVEAKLPGTVTVSGTLAAEEEVVLSSKVQGRIRQIFVDLGSPVRRGQSLLELEPADFQLRVQQAGAAYQQALVRLGLNPGSEENQSNVDPEQTGVVRQAKAQLTEAELTRNRRESLYKEGLIARSELDDAEAAYQVAAARYQDALEEVRNRQALLMQRAAELNLARQQLSDSTLRAPLDGAIQERRVSPGEFITAGQPVLTLVRMHPLRLKLALPEREAGNVRSGQKVDVHVEGDGATYSGYVARLSPAISADNRTLMVEAEVPNENGRLRPGSFARAEIITQPEHAAVLIPASSVITFAGIQKVISIEKDQTIEKRVKTGRRSNDRIEITEGLLAGEPVVIEPGNMVGGEKVIPIW